MNTHVPAAHLHRSLTDTPDDTGVSVIVKVRGDTCDVDCLHCYEKRKDSPGGARVDADQIRTLPALFPGRPIAVGLHGGEPLTAGKTHVAGLLRELAAMEQVINVTLQTNGVQLDAEWLDLFEAVYPQLRIGISLDGDAEGNRWRVGYDGEPIYPKVTAALDLLAQRGRSASVITTVTPAVLGRPAETLDHLAHFPAVTAVSLVPCFDATITAPTRTTARRLPTSRRMQIDSLAGPAGPDWSITPGQYAEFVVGASVHWVRSGLFKRIKLSPTVSTIRAIQGLDSASCHFSDRKCDHIFTLYPGARLGSCDELPWPQAQLTTVTATTTPDTVTTAQRESTLLGQGHALMNKCVTCSYRSTCGGGCVATRWRMTRPGRDGDDAYCDYRQRIIDATAGLIADPHHPEGAHCRTLRWRPRDPNAMSDVAGLIARWNDPAAPRTPAVLHTSAFGNINTVGLPGVRPADDLDPLHPQWADGIEPGVRPLVEAVTGPWGLITYDSCEGHRYDQDRHTGRRVGILPRTPSEYHAAATALCHVSNSLTAALPATVRLLVARANLTCETTGSSHPVLDIRLTPATADVSGYFADLDDATSLLTDALTRTRPAPDRPCPCPRGSGSPASAGTTKHA
ncbi:radical SAM protein [Streptomyces sp. NPDC101455]|uniref:radical SAM protein n=1 Tax=Streptomyces sp. NPDC101455 TaxID=3366142 RepID=UPI0038214B56